MSYYTFDSRAQISGKISCLIIALLNNVSMVSQITVKCISVLQRKLL